MNNSRYEEFCNEAKRNVARAKAFAEALEGYSLDEEDIAAIKMAFPQAKFKCVGAYLGAYDEEYHEVLLERWKSEQKTKISSILNDTTEWYQAKWEDSLYFGWCAVNFFPDDGEEYYGYCKVSKKELAEMLAEEEPYIDAGRVIENEYVLDDLGDKIDPANFVYLEEAGFNI